MQEDSADDEQLAREAAQGSADARRRLYERHADSLYEYLSVRLGADAEDVFQEVFVAAFRSIGDFDGRSSVATWLRSIARNKAADRIKERMRERGRLLPWADAEELIEGQQDVSQAKDKGTIPAEDVQLMVRAVLSDLPDEPAELLVLKYVHRLSVREIKGRLALSEKAVESRLTRAREAFRRSFAERKQRWEQGP